MKKMSSWLKIGSFNEKDEYYTPKILVEPIIKYLKKGSTIWCPFDTENSEFVINLTKAGFDVIYSHLWEGKDFFTYEPKHYDYIISNPPFTRKLEVLDRLYKIGKPFAVILGLPIFFIDKELQLLIVDKKVSFDGNTASFNNSYFCCKLLPKDIIFEHLENNNSKQYFVKSRMFNDLPQPVKKLKNGKTGIKK